MNPFPGPYDLPVSFYEFAFMPKFDDNIESLASLAEPEDWDYHNTPMTESKPILRNYVKYTYQRIAEEKKEAVTKDEKAGAEGQAFHSVQSCRGNFRSFVRDLRFSDCWD